MSQILNVRADEIRVGDVILVATGEPLTVVSAYRVSAKAYAHDVVIGVVSEGSGYEATNFYPEATMFLIKRENLDV